MCAKTNFAEEVQGLARPFLVVIGENDTEGLDEPTMKAAFLAWQPNAELVTIPNSGHYPMQEAPPYFATVIEDFLRQHTG
ncbi:MAG: alpha/beta hydrolase [Acidobacteria bacterium]|nr:alpha/beta hydrolase [Acidobacteriota bacterium]